LRLLVPDNVHLSKLRGLVSLCGPLADLQMVGWGCVITGWVRNTIDPAIGVDLQAVGNSVMRHTEQRWLLGELAVGRVNRLWTKDLLCVDIWCEPLDGIQLLIQLRNHLHWGRVGVRAQIVQDCDVNIAVRCRGL
jgi:hypothetical protein